MLFPHLCLSRFSHYRDTSFLPCPICVPILALSRHIFSSLSYLCPDSRTIETHLLFPARFVSRFPHYRDISSLPFPICVPIPALSRHIFFSLPDLCPDSLTIETHLLFPARFVSRFSHYRDISSLPFPICVPIPALSRHIFSSLSYLCPDFSHYQTQVLFPHLLVSQFPHYRDTSSLPYPMFVPIPALSRHIFSSLSYLCPDSRTIEIQVALSSPLFVQIPALSRHNSYFLPYLCPDSRTIKTHPLFPLPCVSRFPHYRDTSSLSSPMVVPILTLSDRTPTISPKNIKKADIIINACFFL